MQQAVRWWLIVFGAVCVGIGLAHMLFGSATIIGGGSVTATVDSELRFYAVLFVAFGLAFVWCAGELVERRRMIDVLGAIFFVGGLVRLLSWAAAGSPHWFFQLMTLVELVIPPLNFLLVRRVAADRSAVDRAGRRQD